MKVELIKYVVRNISRKKKQTFFTVVCISVSSFVILNNIALDNGIRAKLKEGINQAFSGQLTVYSSDNAKINILESQLKEQEPFDWGMEDSDYLQGISKNITLNKRIRFGSFISLGEETSYTNIHALEANHLERINKLITIKHGAIPVGDNGILISKTIAENLHCNIGDTLLLVADNIHDYMSDEIAIVEGIFEEAGLASFFAYTAFIPYSFGEEIVQLENANSLEIVVNSTTNTDISDKVAKQMNDYLAFKPGNLKMVTWDKTVPLLFTIATIWDSSGYLTQVVFLIFSLMILINLTSLIVYSRKKEFGTLLAFGFSWKKITLLTCIEYLLINAFAIFTASIIAYTICRIIPDAGFYIPSNDMQQALMTEYLRPFLYLKNASMFFYYLVLP